MIAHDHEYLTVREAADLLRVSVPTIRRWIAAGRLRAVRFGARAIRIKRAELRVTTHSVRPRRPMTLEELEPYIIRGGDPRRSPAEVMDSIEAINKRVLARRGGKPLDSSLALIHEARRERDERF